MAGPADIDAVRDAFASLARSVKRVSVYRHARDQHLAYLEPALADLRSLLEKRAAVTVTLEPNALRYENEVVHSEPARETGLCFRLHHDGVRSLTFRRGLGLEELRALAYVAMMDQQSEEGGREDAVTELWKADLSHIAYSAGAGYRMDESAGETLSSSIVAITARAQLALDQHVGESFVEAAQQPPLWSDRQREKADPQDYGALARRAALTILRIVEQEYAGWDLEALKESFWRLIDQMVQHGQGPALAYALDRMRRIGGSHAAEFRSAVGKWLADPSRIEAAVKLATGSERPPLVAAWAQILPPDAGPALLQVLPAGRDAAARNALARIESCEAQVSEVLRKGSAAEVQALLASMASLPPLRRAALATAAFENPAAEVRLDAIPLVAGDPQTAVRSLGTALSSPAGAVRVAAAQALAACSGVAEQAAALILEAMGRPLFARVDKEERTVFYRSLGKLGSMAGHTFLLDQLSRPAKKLFGRKKAIDDQLLAVQGLAEEASQRSLRALEEVLLPSRKFAPAVVAACRAAAQYVRAAAKGGKTA
jgi:hypothetical protein